MKVVALCQEHGGELYWKKTDLNHTVLPDDVFAIKGNGATSYYFFELENKRKSFKEMLEKYRRFSAGPLNWGPSRRDGNSCQCSGWQFLQAWA